VSFAIVAVFVFVVFDRRGLLRRQGEHAAQPKVTNSWSSFR
jgi:hypothetical protein